MEGGNTGQNCHCGCGLERGKYHKQTAGPGMKICLSGSMAVIDQMEELSTQLKALGHQTLVPSLGSEPQFSSHLRQATTQEMKALFAADHLEKIRESDVLVVANFKRNGVDGYLGSSTLMEAAMAYALGKRIYALCTPVVAEIESDLKSLGVIFLNGELGLLK